MILLRSQFLFERIDRCGFMIVLFGLTWYFVFVTSESIFNRSMVRSFASLMLMSGFVELVFALEYVSRVVNILSSTLLSRVVNLNVPLDWLYYFIRLGHIQGPHLLEQIESHFGGMIY